MERVYNFSSGPAAINEDILKEIQDEFLNCLGSGMSILEINHRSGLFLDIMNEATEILRTLLDLSDEYEVMYVSGGGYMQFSMIPYNLLGKYGRALFIDTDVWTKYAIEETSKFGKTEIVASSSDRNYTYIPKKLDETKLTEADYLYFCTNNTSSGTSFHPDRLPQTGKIPLVADMTSNFLSDSYDINKFGLVFAAAQKNLGPTGLSIVIAKKELINQADETKIPKIMCYKAYAESSSLFSTPSTFAIYMVLLVLRWIKKNGGIKEMKRLNMYKADMLYRFIDESEMFHNKIDKQDRSIMNVVFSTRSKQMDQLFIKEAEKAGLYHLAGYHSFGGLRAGIYNGVETRAVEALVTFMKEFELQHKGDYHV